MIIDLAKYDLIPLVLGENWEEPEQAEFVARFTALMGKYMGEKLASDMPEGADQEFSTMLSAGYVSPQDVEQFYKTKMPNIQEKIDEYILEFKKLFLSKYYAQEVELLKSNPTSPHASLLPHWEKVVAAVEQDDWDTVMATINAIRDQEFDQAVTKANPN